MTAVDDALARIAHDVHLVLNNYYSGRTQEQKAAMPAYARLTVIFEKDEDTLRSPDEIIEAALDPVKFGLHPRAVLSEDQNTGKESAVK